MFVRNFCAAEPITIITDIHQWTWILSISIKNNSRLLTKNTFTWATVTGRWILKEMFLTIKIIVAFCNNFEKNDLDSPERLD